MLFWWLFFRVGQLRRDVENLFPATVKYDGSISWYIAVIHQSSCQLDITYFPWDHQQCQLLYLSWTYDLTALDLHNHTASGSLEYALKDGEWLIQDFPVHRTITYYPEPFAEVTYTLMLERKPTYYIINIVLPCVFITFCGMLVFLLPPDSGERVSMSVTMLLSSTVFLLIVAEIMPAQSDTIPLISKY